MIVKILSSIKRSLNTVDSQKYKENCYTEHMYPFLLSLSHCTKYNLQCAVSKIHIKKYALIDKRVINQKFQLSFFMFGN